MKRFARIVSLWTAGLALALTGCDSQSSDEGTPPAVIPPAVFQVQTDLFAPAAGKTLAKFNFANAALRVWPVSVILQANLLIPAAVTAAALEDTPEYVDDAWEWSSTRAVGDNSLTFTLRGMPADDGVLWTMLISADDPINGQAYDEFELYSGHTEPGGTAGSWQLFYLVDGAPRNVLDAEYNYAGDASHEVRFHVPETAAEHGGDYVLYVKDNDLRRFLWQQAAEGIDHDVRWNEVTKTGSIEATNYNGGAEACWDETFEDVDCP